MTVQIDLVEALEQLCLQAVTQIGHIAGFPRQLVLRDLAGCAKPDDSRDVQSARAHSALVTTTVDDRGQPHTRALRTYVKRSDALGTVDLVSTHREQIDA